MSKGELATDFSIDMYVGVSAIYPRNCWEAYQRGKNVSGIYTIRPDSGPPFSVWCDQVTDGGGWTVFQRRQDGSVNFQKNRIDYVRGFGEVTGEHWLGLEKIHRLTKWSDFSPELWIDLEDFENETRFASYRNFWMEGPTSYTLQVQQYSGTAGDSLTYHRTVGFSTPDWDIDNSRGNCAVSHQGSWWFNNCYYSNLNGVYYHGKTTAGKGILWIHWKGNAYSLKRTEMKIRPSRWSRLIN